jgi:hypothetical protein
MSPARLQQSVPFLCAGIALVLLGGMPSRVTAARPYAVWVVGKGERNGQEVVVRWRDAMPDAGERAEYPWCAVITWHVRRDERGTWLKDDAERAADFETELEERIGSSGTATEVVSVTDDDTNEWIYYAADRESIPASIEAIERDDPGLAVSYEIHADRDWQGLYEILSTVKQ